MIVQNQVRRNTRRVIVTTIAAFGIALTACGGGGGDGQSRGPGGKNGEGGKKDSVDTAVPVSVVETLQGDMVAAVSFSATVESEQAVKVYPQISGLVDRVYAEEGDRVEAGQVLLRLEDDDARLALRDAQIELDKAVRDSARQAELFSKDLISRDEYEQAVYEANRSRIAVEEAELAYTRTRIRAQVAGVIAERDVELGDRVSTSAPVYELVTMSDLVARVYVPGRHRPNLRVGQPAQVTSDMLPGYEIHGRIRRISPVIDPQSGTVKVTVELSDPERKLAPGMFANVALITERQPEALLAPKEALVYDAGQPYVFIVRGDKAHRTRLELGLANSRQVQVLGGLSRGDSVVVVGHEGLRDGATVRVIADATSPIPPEEPQAAESDEADSTGTTTAS